MKQIAMAFMPMVMLLTSAPALAEWSHPASGISIPDQIEDLKKGETRDVSGGKETDVAVQYGSGPLAATVYVYKASYPNPALWYERTIALMSENVGGFDGSAKPIPITLAGSPRANGLRQSFEINNPNGRAGVFKSTSFALIQVNDWMLKLRISSQNLGKDEVDKKMSALIDALKFSRTVADPLPLVTPSPCTDQAPAYKGKPIDGKVMEKTLPESMAQGMVVMAEASGFGGLAKEAEKWCSFALTEAPAALATGYREKQNGNYVILVADSGRTIAAQAMALIDSKAKATLFANVQGATKLVWMFDGLPTPDKALAGGFRVALGQEEGLITIDFGSKAQNEKDDTGH